MFLACSINENVQEETVQVYLFSLANTSCTCNHDNCFRFSNKANKDLFRFRLPLPKNKLHSSYISFISWNKKDETLSL